jgi:hypothetical protein
MVRVKIESKRPTAQGWMVFSTWGDQNVTLSDGEVVPHGCREGRPATLTEIEAEQAKRAEKAERRKLIDAFRARPEWEDADMIRSTIEMMEHDNHPLDKLTPEEWRALRIKICG